MHGDGEGRQASTDGVLGASRPCAAVPGFVEQTFTAAGSTRAVLRHGEGPVVLLMHELLGPTPPTIDFARFVAAQGFHVAMPVFFGTPTVEGTVLGGLATLCIRREFAVLGSGRASPIADWLRPLCRALHAEAGGRGIGVIGMCFSGGFVLSTMLEPSVVAPVCAQPSLPLWPRAGLDIAPDDLARVVDASRSRPLLFVRFRDDRLSPAARQTTLEAAFAGRGRLETCILAGRGHSTLVYDRPACGSDPRTAVVDHLRAQLLG